MTNEPMSLFKNIMMRKPDESSLRKALVTDKYSNKFDLTLGQINYSYEMDGGALLHKVSWVNGSNLKKIAKSYVHYVRKHYGKSYLVSDEYESASTKSVEQNRRGKRFQKCPDVNVKKDIIVPLTQEKFIFNTNNKVQLIKILSGYFKDDRNEVR